MFAGRHFDREVILLCVRWYLRYKLSLRGHRSGMSSDEQPSRELSMQHAARTNVHLIEV